MKIRDPKSIIIILVYAAVCCGIIGLSFLKRAQEINTSNKAQALAPEYTYIENLDYFHLKNGVPLMSLSATRMKSLGEETAEFEDPKGVYNYQQKNKSLRYQALEALYRKDKEILTLEKDVKVTSDEGDYFAQKLKYFFKKDLIIGTVDVKFLGDDPKSGDKLNIASDKMKAWPNEQKTDFFGNVHGSFQRKKEYEGKMIFSSAVLNFDGNTSLAHLEGDVMMKRQSYLITSGKADITLENYNKSLKYFVLNDDVKVTETVHTPQGVQQRKAFSERLEGFGREQRMILSGAPRVEMGTDVVRGYRITIREDIDLIEVDDAVSDMLMKKKEKLKE